MTHATIGRIADATGGLVLLAIGLLTGGALAFVGG
jgi:hypothetical protein